MSVNTDSLAQEAVFWSDSLPSLRLQSCNQLTTVSDDHDLSVQKSWLVRR